MRPATATAAGKLMVAGEYAVLGPAGCCLSLAVGAIAEARVAPAHGEPARRTLSAFGQTWRWQHAQAAPPGLAQRIDATLEIAALRAVAAAAHVEVQVDGQLAGKKLGLGTSAAAMVATLRALVASALPADDTPDTLAAWSWLHGAHQQGQGGRGSGYDLATILAGGVIRYRREPTAWSPLAWPEGLYAAALFTGESAATDARLRAHAQVAGAPVAEIAAAERAVAAQWRRGDVSALLDALADAERAFDGLADRVPGLRTAAVERTRRAIADSGGVARTSGAGGGDCVLAFAESADRIEALAAAWQGGGGAVAARLPDELCPSTHNALTRATSREPHHEGPSDDHG